MSEQLCRGQGTVHGSSSRGTAHKGESNRQLNYSSQSLSIHQLLFSLSICFCHSHQKEPTDHNMHQQLRLWMYIHRDLVLWSLFSIHDKFPLFLSCIRALVSRLYYYYYCCCYYFMYLSAKNSSYIDLRGNGKENGSDGIGLIQMILFLDFSFSKGLGRSFKMVCFDPNF